MNNLQPGIRIEFAFGIGQDKEGRGLNPAWAKLGCDNIIFTATGLFGGCTMVVTEGDWINSAGNRCRESGRVLSVSFSGYNSADLALEANALSVAAVIDCIKRELQQEAVCVTVTEVRTGIL